MRRTQRRRRERNIKEGVMSLREKLNEELKASMKARDKERTGALRLLLSEVKKEVDHENLPDDKIISIVSHMIKEREDSIKQYKDAGRPELAVKEEGEIKVISEFLPAQLSDDEVSSLIDEAVSATGAAGMKDMGKVMAYLKPKVQGRTDMGALSGRVKAKLA